MGKRHLNLWLSLFLICSISCTPTKEIPTSVNIEMPSNVLNYKALYTEIGKKKKLQNTGLAFSDQGAWFAYGFPAKSNKGHFEGPFLMTQENGKWMDDDFYYLDLSTNNENIDWNDFELTTNAYNSHLEQVYQKEGLTIFMTLFFTSPHSALIQTKIQNTSNQTQTLKVSWVINNTNKDFSLNINEDYLSLSSNYSDAEGYIKSYTDDNTQDEIEIVHTSVGSDLPSTKYGILRGNEFELEADATKEILLSQTFIFPEYDWSEEQEHLKLIAENPTTFLNLRKQEKTKQFQKLKKQLNSRWTGDLYQNLLSKCLLTLQNNWRVPAGELKHSGLFPSYHYEWFHGFWAWDSWKHAVALAKIDIELAKEQIRAMYDFEDENGFIADCVYRDTTIEAHNYRNTKPPLSAWAVWAIYEEEKDTEF